MTLEIEGRSDASLESVRFDAYRRQNGDIGVRNRVLVVPSVICSQIVANRIADEIEGAVSTPHDHGCAQIGADNEQTANTLVNIARNPNVAGATVVGLGCEHVQSGTLADRIASCEVPVRHTSIQDAGGTDVCVSEGTSAAAELAARAETSAVDEVSLSELTIGIISSDLRKSTREVADPFVGELVADLLGAGVGVLVAGTERLAPHVETAVERAEDDETADAIRAAANTYATQPGRARGVVHQAAEQSFEEVTGAWGDGSISEFVPYGDQATCADGLALVDAPSRFEEAATGLGAAGASIVIHITGEGVPTGHPVVPVLKVTGDETTASALPEDIDIDATRSTPNKLRSELVRAAGGKQTAAEIHGLSAFAITRVGPSL
ncbi:UxaA family hydrolase (plasmid) [Haloferacaceae archaeon DSL9]